MQTCINGKLQTVVHLGNIPIVPTSLFSNKLLLLKKMLVICVRWTFNSSHNIHISMTHLKAINIPHTKF